MFMYVMPHKQRIFAILYFMLFIIFTAWYFYPRFYFPGTKHQQFPMTALHHIDISDDIFQRSHRTSHITLLGTLWFLKLPGVDWSKYEIMFKLILYKITNVIDINILYMHIHLHVSTNKKGIHENIIIVRIYIA